jgi:hypothetical protein
VRTRVSGCALCRRAAMCSATRFDWLITSAVASRTAAARSRRRLERSIRAACARRASSPCPARGVFRLLIWLGLVPGATVGPSSVAMRARLHRSAIGQSRLLCRVVLLGIRRDGTHFVRHRVKRDGEAADRAAIDDADTRQRRVRFIFAQAKPTVRTRPRHEVGRLISTQAAISDQGVVVRA